MELLLTHNTALEAYRTIGLRERLSEARPCFDAVPRGAPSLERVSELAGILSRYGFEPTRMEALIGDVACRRRWPHLTTRICKKELPAKSIALLEGGIACVCPEHLAVQMAPLLTELELQVLLCELLGVYAVSPAVPGGMLQVGEPLMTKESLQKTSRGAWELRWRRSCAPSSSGGGGGAGLADGDAPLFAIDSPVALWRLWTDGRCRESAD